MSDVESSYIVLETERLILRRQRSRDVAALVDLWTDPEVTRFLGGPREPDQLRSSLEATAADPLAERSCGPRSRGRRGWSSATAASLKRRSKARAKWR